jgi:hypothetical protein
MRALCGAIITAGALLGLGLTAQGLGTRYAQHYTYTEEGKYDWEASQVKIHQLDNPMKVILVVLVACVIIGLAVTFLGLAFHHHRRHHEHLHRLQSATTSPRVTV